MAGGGVVGVGAGLGWGTVSVVGEGVWQEEGVLGEYREGWSVQGEVGVEVEEWGWVKGGGVCAAGDGSGMGWGEVGVRPGAGGRVSGGVEDWVRVGWVWGGEDSWYGRHPEALRLECGMRIHF
ncbi:hypothetical protein [Spirochaeta thermophila]|uniref:hypothetical protein n=1 Tax=Winmispira thermophila TaxID=154 RepID=UPI0018723634|nr:hypothetical protein [Spirochaeta thermophila]